MNLFLAAVYTNAYKPGMKLYSRLNEREKQIMTTIPHILESYHYVHKKSFVNAMRDDGAQVFLDSGAFSAFTMGVEIDLPTYCRYCQENEDIIRKEDGVLMASVLDGIGDPLQTYRNQKAMEMLGVTPLPCFHYGEDPRYLEYYVKNYPYITIGGMVGKPVNQLIKWLDDIWEKYMTDGAGNPLLKVHAFGITSIPVMERYPWFSCDSSSWIQMTSFGNVMDPIHGPISVSSQSPSRHDAGRHLSNYSPLEQKYMLDRIEQNGFNYERLSEEYVSRAAYNALGFCEINKNINKDNANRLNIPTQGLF